MKPRFGSLFSGIGGLDLGLERAGWECAWQSEIAEYPSRVLAKHWPHVPNLGDVTKIEWESVERVDLICGGYPCQPFSTAGVRRGEADERHLWPYFRDALSVLRPRLALLENVPGHLSLGFERVHADLAALGYDTEWDCIPAAAVGAPHLRWRVFIVAYPNRDGYGGTQDARRMGRLDSGNEDAAWERQRSRPVTVDRSATLADTEGIAERPGLRADEPRKLRWGRPGDSGCERHAWSVEPDVGRVAYGVPSRVDRLRGLGNAVVPQVAEFIGAQLLEYVGAVA